MTLQAASFILQESLARYASQQFYGQVLIKFNGCRISDNEEIGFRDVKFDEMMGGRSSLPEDFMEEKEREMCLEVFKEYKEMEAERY